MPFCAFRAAERNGHNDEKYGQSALVVIILLELAVAVLNTALPMSFITEDTQKIDIPMNYLSLYMRPVIFSSLALIYRIWLDLRNTECQKENRQTNPGLESHADQKRSSHP